MMDEISKPGSILRAERERQGLVIADVVPHLKLSEKQVEALENDDYEALPGDVFVRGFIRNYAKMLQIDPGPLLDSVRENLPQKTEIQPPRDVGIPFSPGPRRNWIHYAIALVLIAFSVLGYQIYRAGHPGTAKQVPAEKPPISAPLPKPVSEPVAPAPLPSEKNPEAGQIHVPVEKAPAPAASAVSAAPVKDAVVGQGPIRLVFSAPSWVQIRDKGGRLIYSKLGQAGTEQQVSGMAPFMLTIGNARQVKLFYKGSEVDLASHTRIDVAHLTLQ